MSEKFLSIGSDSSLGIRLNLSRASDSLSGSYERLSSGMRINKASDDAAGLSIATSLRAETRVHLQAIRNTNDGLSALNIASSSIQQLTEIATRIEELAVQAANGVFSSKQRASMDAEAQALSKEYTRIARTTEFNGLNLLDGSFGPLNVQAGYGTGGVISSGLGGAIGDGTFKAQVCFVTGEVPDSITLGDLNGDGILDLVTSDRTGGIGSSVSVLLGNGDGSFSSRTCFTTGLGPWSATLGDVNGDGTLDIITSSVTADTASVLLGNGDGSFKAEISSAVGIDPYAVALGDINGDGVLDLVTSNMGSDNVSVLIGNGDGSFTSQALFATGDQDIGLKLGDVNGDSILDIVAANQNSNTVSVLIGNGNGSFKAQVSLTVGTTPKFLALGDLNGDGKLDIIAPNNGSDNVSIMLGNGDGSFKSQNLLAAGSLPFFSSVADVNGDGVLDIITANNGSSNVSIFIGNGDGTFKAQTSVVSGDHPCGIATGDLNGDSVVDFVAANYGPVDYSGNTLSVFIANTRDGTSPLLPFSLSTRADALQALPLIERSLQILSLQNSKIGALQSRFETALSNIGALAQGYSAARSRIEDADVAEDSAILIKSKILQDASTAVLAQANQQQARVLALLQP